jgi:hypothetical protein
LGIRVFERVRMTIARRAGCSASDPQIKKLGQD